MFCRSDPFPRVPVLSSITLVTAEFSLGLLGITLLLSPTTLIMTLLVACVLRLYGAISCAWLGREHRRAVLGCNRPRWWLVATPVVVRRLVRGYCYDFQLEETILSLSRQRDVTFQDIKLNRFIFRSLVNDSWM